MTNNEIRTIKESIRHAQDELWRIHYRIEDEAEAKRLDKRIGTILCKLEELQFICSDMMDTSNEPHLHLGY